MSTTTALTTAMTTTMATTSSRQRPWVLRLARAYARRALRQRFDGVFVAGLDEARALIATRPVIFASNHVSWWDAFMLVTVDEALGGGGHAVMDEENLRRLPFFAALGAVPVDRSGGARLRRQLDGAAALVRAPGQSLWFFPQGRQRAAHLRPLGLLAGLRLIARRSGAVVVPVSLSYPWREAPAPSICVTLHAPIDGARKDLLDAVEAAIIAGLDAGDAALDAGTRPAGVELVPAPPQKGAQDGAGARLLARLLSTPGARR